MSSSTLATETARSVPEYLEIVNTYWARWFRSEDERLSPWFRGQADANWTLLPGSYREDCAHSDENSFRHEFRLRAFPFLADATYPPQSDWDWYFLMQHYGLPTRLLDWTESALVGLFFVLPLNTRRATTDGAVWMLDPYHLNSAIAGQGYLGPYDSRSARRYLGRIWKRASIPVRPLALEPPHNSRRVAAQRGKFTIHGSSRQPLENYRSLAKGLVKILVPCGHFVAIERELSIAGITDPVVFPELAGLGRGIRRDWLRSAPEKRRPRRKA